MPDFRTIHGAQGYAAHQLGRMGEVTGGWRIYRHGEALCECASEVDARIMLHVLSVPTGKTWDAARRIALNEMRKEAA